MKFRVYLWIEGDGFDPSEFQRAAGPILHGTVAERKRMVDGVAVVSARYWRSDEVGPIPPERVDDALRELLIRLRDALRATRSWAALTIFAEIVEEYLDVDSIAGIYLSPGTIQLLAEMNAHVDIDIVRDLS